jgi:hypothetical protein
MEGRRKARIKLRVDVGINAALGELIRHVDVFAFQEMIPSFNDIFIEVVTYSK